MSQTEPQKQDTTDIAIHTACPVSGTVTAEVFSRTDMNPVFTLNDAELSASAASEKCGLVLIDIDEHVGKLAALLDLLDAAGFPDTRIAGISKTPDPSPDAPDSVYRLKAILKKPLLYADAARFRKNVRRYRPNAADQPDKGLQHLNSFDSMIPEIDNLKKTASAVSLCTLIRIVDSRDTDEVFIPVAVEALQTVMMQNDDYLLFTLLQGGEKSFAAAARLAEEKSFPKAAPLLAKKAETTRNPTLLKTVLSAFRHIPYDGAIPVLETHTRNSDSMVAASAVSGLSGQNGNRACRILSRLVKNGDEIVAYTAARALGEIGTSRRIYALIDHIHHPNPDIRKAVGESLVRIGPAAADTICEQLSSMPEDDMISGVTILGRIRSEQSIELLGELSDHDSPNVRHAAVEALGRIGSEKALSHVAGMLDRTDYRLICAAVESINNNINNPDLSEMLADRIVPIAEQPGETGRNLLQAVADMKATAIFTALAGHTELTARIASAVGGSANKHTLLSFLRAASAIADESPRKGVELILQKALKNLSDEAGKPTILVVDDSKAILGFYRSVLSKRGFAVLTALNGEDAAARLRETKEISLVVTDINMPVKTGIELIREIREKLSSSLPVLVCTTESQKEQVDIAMKAGANAFITKPFTQEELERKIRQHLS